ncbi:MULTISPECIES: DUF1684 domain-containing protein [unclassified Streptomyces]|uniref:DUF1684 domain-containing protein n=1 Tax=unclassified Streptomyces TaxID=2593676 RepID=UPI0019041075|nr:DUF1684 domain-containing protein [Streptomyces sp. HSG2]
MYSSTQGSWPDWRIDRIHAVTSTHGALALVSAQCVDARPTSIEALSGAAAWHPDGAPGLVVSADASLGVRVDGRLVDGEEFVDASRPDGGPVIECGPYLLDVFSLDRIDYELRVYRSGAPGLRSFRGIETYPYDESWVTIGEISPSGGGEAVPWSFTRAADSGRTKIVPFTVTVDVMGSPYELLPFEDGDDVVLVVADATTGEESSPQGRFLRLARPAAGEPSVLDFNYLYIPPCAFSDAFSCPLPPLRNEIAAPIRAGEKRVLWTTEAPGPLSGR